MIISKLLRLKIYGFLLWFYQQHDDIPKKLSILKYIQKPTLKVNYFLRRICNYFANKIIYKKYFEVQSVFFSNNKQYIYKRYFIKNSHDTRTVT